MPKVALDKRSRLIQAALKLVYQQGFERTALADIAREAQVPVGNVYYYFKTKADICAAIVDERVGAFRALREAWERAGAPKQRLLSYVQMTLDSQEAVARHGCPVGTLCSELHKAGGPLARKATVLFAEALQWIEAQFRVLGKADPRGLALHFLSSLQGASVLAHAFHDPKVLATEGGRISEWIRTL